MSGVADTIELGREAFACRRWGDARMFLAAGESLEAPDLELLAVAAHLVGRDVESAQAWERAHLAYVQLGDLDHAARCAFWLVIGLMLRGDTAHAAGWLGRAERTIENAEGECAAHAFLLVPAFLQALGAGEHAEADALGG